mgnify:CR=1 FL=1
MNNIKLVSVISSKRRLKMSNNLVSQDNYLNKSEINSNNYIMSEVNSVNLLDEYFNYILLVIVCLLFYSALYIIARFVLEIIFYLINKQKFSKGDLVIVTTKPWKGCVGKITKVGVFSNNIKITKDLNKFKKIPKKMIKKTVNEIKQT